jgi:IclR family transcriptional regulator, acetate operon repressor
VSERKLIQSIERAAAILEIIAYNGGVARLQQISEEAGLGKTTAHNILATLEALGYVRRRPGDVRYHLGERILNLARITGDDNALRARLRPTLEKIAERTGETAFLVVPSGDELYYLDAVASARDAGTGGLIGQRERLEGSAAGSVFLATMPGLRKRVLAMRAQKFCPGLTQEIIATQRRGFAIDLQCHRSGLNCVAVPYREHGDVRASIGVRGPASRLMHKDLHDLAWKLMREAEEADKSL